MTNKTKRRANELDGKTWLRYSMKITQKSEKQQTIIGKNNKI